MKFQFVVCALDAAWRVTRHTASNAHTARNIPLNTSLDINVFYVAKIEVGKTFCCT
jgi:hypothetical protein